MWVEDRARQEKVLGLRNQASSLHTMALYIPLIWHQWPQPPLGTPDSLLLSNLWPPAPFQLHGLQCWYHLCCHIWGQARNHCPSTGVCSQEDTYVYFYLFGLGPRYPYSHSQGNWGPDFTLIRIHNFTREISDRIKVGRSKGQKPAWTPQNLTSKAENKSQKSVISEMRKLEKAATPQLRQESVFPTIEASNPAMQP